MKQNKKPNKETAENKKSNYEIFNDNFYRFCGKQPIDFIYNKLMKRVDVKILREEFEYNAAIALNSGGTYIGFADYFVTAAERIRMFEENNCLIVYNKLVRDNVPDIIEAEGNKCKTEILNYSDYIKALKAKLKEEVSEYLKDDSMEKLSDVLEVMGAIVKAKGYTWDKLTKIRKNKKKIKGSFEKRINLVSVINKEKIKKIKASSKEWRKSDDEKLADMCTSGASIELLSDYFNRFEYDIIGRLLQLNLY